MESNVKETVIRLKARNEQKEKDIKAEYFYSDLLADGRKTNPGFVALMVNIIDPIPVRLNHIIPDEHKDNNEYVLLEVKSMVADFLN